MFSGDGNGFRFSEFGLFFDIGTELVLGNEVTCDELNHCAGRGGVS